MNRDATAILGTLTAAAAETDDRNALGRVVVEALAAAFPQASWTGIYWLEGTELVLGPYVGPDTEHTRIAVGEGVCGTAIREEADQRVDDVREVPAYLACAPGVRSELVVLVHAGERIVGQLDLDADEVAAFDADDHCLVRTVADAFGGLVGDGRATSP